MSAYYRAKGKNNADLISTLRQYGIIKSDKVEKAMKEVDRKDFSADMDEAYHDIPHPIGHGATISAPHMHAMCSELLQDQICKPKARILDVGSGSGYLSAVMARMAPDDAKVIGIEYVPALVDFSISNMRKHNKELLDSGKVSLKVGDGWKGDPENAPFDAIHVGAAAETMPQALIDQLAPGGRMIIPVGGYSQHLIQVDKNMQGKVEEQTITPVRYVPLVKQDKQKKGGSAFEQYVI
jgi:protein-L-isoaspartate(D-aspartate) O-methyltransferase